MGGAATPLPPILIEKLNDKYKRNVDSSPCRAFFSHCFSSCVVLCRGGRIDYIYIVLNCNCSRPCENLFHFQVLVPTIWIASGILNISLFLTIYFDKAVNFCMEYWPNDWLPKAYSSMWFFSAGVIPILLMSVLYSRVVCRLWFKREPNNNDVANQV